MCRVRGNNRSAVVLGRAEASASAKRFLRSRNSDLKSTMRAGVRFFSNPELTNVALSEPLSWRDPRLAEIPLIHLSDGSASTGIACAEAEAGLLPRHPTVVVGRQYLLDPARVPAGAAALWLQLQ